jgi:hypothetical protein
VGGRTVRIRTVHTVRTVSTDLAQKSRQFLAQFSRQISDFCCCFWAVRNSPYNTLLAQKSRYKRRSYNSTDLARFSRQNLVGLFWCCEVFSLAGNVYLLLFCTFLKLNNNISLSLSWVSPHWGFPWHLPKFLSFMGCCPLCLFPLLFCLAMCISAYGNF